MLRVGWRGALLVSAFPALVAALAWSFVAAKRTAAFDAARPKEPPVEQGSSPGGNGPGVGQGFSPARLPFILLTASYTLQGYVGYIFVFWFYLYLVQERHFDLLRGAFLGSLPWVLTIVSVPLGGLVSDRLARRGASPWRLRIVPMAGLVGAGVFIAIGAAHRQSVGRGPLARRRDRPGDVRRGPVLGDHDAVVGRRRPGGQAAS